MSTILRIFIKDLRGICRNIFALIIAIGLCIIPSLYAWFNIYSNWDPYANTASIKIAVYSEDTGFDMDGEYQNMGNSIIDNLKENDKLGWTFTKDMESTIDGVKSGKYYAAIVIGDNFSRSMINFLNDNMETPSVTYYENAKKNAIASKITQSGKSTLQETINETFIETVVVTILNSTDAASLTKTNVLSDISDKLTDISNNLSEYNASISMFNASNDNLSDTLKKTDALVSDMQSNMSEENIEASKNTANNAIDAYTANISASLTRLTDINTKLTGKIETLRGKIADYKNNHTLVTKLDIIKQLGELNSLMNEVINANNEFNNSLKPILEHFKDIDNDNGGNNQFLYDSLISSLDLMPALLKTAAQNMTTFTQWYTDSKADPANIFTYMDDALVQCENSINSLNSILTSSINDSVGKSGELFKTSINSIYDSLVSASDSLSAISTIINGVDSTLSSVNFTLDTMGNLSAMYRIL